MSSDRRTAIAVGILFIIATAAPILTLPFLNPISAPDSLSAVARQPGLLSVGAMLELIMSAAIAAIAVMMHRILRAQSETLAIGYVGARFVEGVLFVVVAVVSLQLLQGLSNDYAVAGSPAGSYHQTLGALLVAAHDQAYLISGRFVFSMSAIILNYSLYRSIIVPRWLSLWGLCGALLLLIGAVLEILGLLGSESVLETVSFLPIAVQEMVFAVWLIAKGFRPVAAETQGAAA